MKSRSHLLLTIFAAIVFIFKTDSIAGQNRYALLIGIGSYPEESGWNRIHGDNDIHIVMANLIRQGFPCENIDTLINSSATKSNIISALEDLCKNVAKGDVVYIHFSGHGQQISDINGDEDDGFDEAWIPYDARKSYQAGIYEGDKHIIDDELNEIFTAYRVRLGERGKIVVIADACHSGSGSRGLDNNNAACVRGTNDRFIIPRGEHNVVKKQNPVEWLYVAACKSYQTNYEYKAPDGFVYGMLSFIVANDQRNWNGINYVDVISGWKDAMESLTLFPQNIDNEGRPCKNSVYMF